MLFERYVVSPRAIRRFSHRNSSFLLTTMPSEVQGECRAGLARALLSRSLHSRCISNALQRYEE